MKNTLFIAYCKLVFFCAVSTAMMLPPKVLAHEVLPTIADLLVTEDGELSLEFSVNLEAFLAGIDLDAVEDTDAAAAADDYDALRALPGEELAARAQEVVTSWNAVPLAETGEALIFQIEQVTVPEGIDIELPRLSGLVLRAPLPSGADEVTVNWPAQAGDMVLRQQGVPEPYTGYLEGGQSSEPISLGGGGAQTSGAAFLSYLPVGFDHILPKGLDHILFVLGLFFLSTKMGPLLWQISAFTLAHTVTLALGALGLVNVPGSIVEPLIAASIVYVAVENLFMRGLSKWRPMVVFGFGLLHGLGFASVLGEFGLPEAQFIPALIGFNVGVELGQLTVIVSAALILAGCAFLARHSGLAPEEEAVGRYPVMFRAASIPGSLLIAVVGAYWSIERVFF